ncbi:MAG TPA: hypothetical protein VJ716_10140 [Gaiellaceae bacterium]|nr:hypothetical protein [Gaiellaceae bacterium]
MKPVALVLGTAAVAVVLAGCGSGAKSSTRAAGPPATIAGVAVDVSGSPPGPSTPAACVRRWNGAGNASGRASAARRAPKANEALVRAADASGYFSEEAGRCLIYLVTPPKSAVVFVETARGTFRFTADASGRFRANADVDPGVRLRLR